MKPTGLEVRASVIDGVVMVPASKSVTHRSFLLASQSSKPCTVSTPLLSADTRATLSCLLGLGARFHLDADRGDNVQFLPSRLAAPRQALDCANSGTTLRLLAGTAARFGQPVSLTGDASLRSRPNGPLLDALRTLGARTESVAGQAPLTIQGPIRSGAVAFPPESSSQFASSLLLALPFVNGSSTVALAPPVSSSPYLDVTLDVASRAGLEVREATAANGGRLFEVPGDQTVHASHLAVDGDWSSAAFPLAAAAVTGGRVTVKGLDVSGRQGDRAIVEFLGAFGCATVLTADGLTLQGGPLTSPGTVDVRATPDLFPILCVVAAVARGVTRFTGGAALRGKETDRIAAMADGLRRLGVDAQERIDGLEVVGGTLRGASVESRGDHRIHMAFAVAGLVATGTTRIDDPACADVSFPHFHEALTACGAGFTPLQGNRTEVAH